LPRSFDLDQSRNNAGLVELATELNRKACARLLLGPDPEHADRLLATGAKDDPVGMRAIALHPIDRIGDQSDIQGSETSSQFAVQLPCAVGQDGQIRAPR